MRGKEVKKVVLCLDITKKVIDFAKKNNCDLIISHHPLKIKVSSLNNHKIEMLNKNKIAAIACHTNFDNSDLGTNYYISKILGLQNPKKDKDSCMFISKYKNPISFKEIASNIKRRLPDSRIIGFDSKNIIKKIGVIGGSGASFIDYAIDKKIDLFITGDIK
jgi:GTP cyclohydrolase I